jgi:RHS repeat-associated protein
LGNIRLSYTVDPVYGDLKVLEENHYYPFGLKHTNYNSDVLLYSKNSLGTKSLRYMPPVVVEPSYNYKYNGKELQDELGLNMYDYGARNYDPALGRWMNIDPYAEMYQDNSPFNFVKNDPVLYFDVDGKFRLSEADQRKYKELSDFLQNDVQKLLDNKKILNSIMKYSGATEEQVRKQFEWGSGALIEIEPLRTAGTALNHLSLTLAQNIADKSITSKKNLLFAILTILHEDVHVLSMLTGLQYDEEFYNKNGEEGYAFEIAAFGRPTRLSDGSFEEVMKELGFEEGVPENDEKSRKAMVDFFNDFSNLEPGKYEWDGGKFIKVD